MRDFVQPPDGMTAIDLPDGRRVFAPAGVDPHAVREHVMIVPAGVKVHLALGYTNMRKGLDRLAILVQQTPSRHRGAHLTNLRAYDRHAER